MWVPVCADLYDSVEWLQNLVACTVYIPGGVSFLIRQVVIQWVIAFFSHLQKVLIVLFKKSYHQDNQRNNI